MSQSSLPDTEVMNSEGSSTDSPAAVATTELVSASSPRRTVERAVTFRLTPESFQEQIIARLIAHVQNADIPALLRAPTGAGKTLMLGRVLEATSLSTGTLWFWFTPYSHLVGQTIAALERTCDRLSVFDLRSERRPDHVAGDVLVGNVQLVATNDAESRRIHLDDDTTVSLDGMLARARQSGLRIGVVIDEAHLGVANNTAFGRLVHTMAPDTLLLATATPRDARLAAFVSAAGFGQHITFRVSRLDAVEGGLNKRYVLAHVYRPRVDAEVADTRATVLARAWERHERLKVLMREYGIQTVPLLLVQVENGRGGVEFANQVLVQQCGVAAGLIAAHTQDQPDPTALATIANDTSREVLIFKESAGTGFDAPRAFVLASMKHVADEGFATQFLGRIMRVDPHVRELFRRKKAEGSRLPAELDTGYLFLAHQELQSGFQAAVSSVQAIQSEMQGALEGLRPVSLRNGTQTFTNIPQTQLEAILRSTLGDPSERLPQADEDEARANFEAQQEAVRQLEGFLNSPQSLPTALPIHAGASTPSVAQASLDEDLLGGNVAPVGVATEPAARPGRGVGTADSRPLEDAEAVRELWNRVEVAVYPLRSDVPGLSRALYTERPPAFEEMGELSQTVAEQLPIEDDDVREALDLALRGVSFRESVTELTSTMARTSGNEVAAGESELAALQTGVREIRGVIDRTKLASEANLVLEGLSFEGDDRKKILTTLSGRIRVRLSRLLDLVNPQMEAHAREQLERDVVHSIVRRRGDALRLQQQRVISQAVRPILAAPLPSAILFPRSAPLLPSPRNIYGVRPPTTEEWENASLGDPPVMELLSRTAYRTHLLSGAIEYHVAYIDGSWRLNAFELRVANALDDAPWIQWWHRNPPLKPFSVGVVKAGEVGRFYPDFVIGAVPFAGARLQTRLLEPKESADDALVRMARPHSHYGRVFFLKLNNNRIFVRDSNGVPRTDVGLDLEGLRLLLESGE